MGPGKLIQRVSGNPYELVDSNTTQSFTFPFSNDAGEQDAETQWTTSAAYSVRRVDVGLAKANSPTGTLSLMIFDDSAGSPGSLVATASNTLDISTITTSCVYYTFYLPATALSDATAYHIVLDSDTTNAAANTVDLCTGTNVGAGTTYSGVLSGTWTNGAVSSVYQGNFKTYE